MTSPREEATRRDGLADVGLEDVKPCVSCCFAFLSLNEAPNLLDCANREVSEERRAYSALSLDRLCWTETLIEDG